MTIPVGAAEGDGKPQKRAARNANVLIMNRLPIEAVLPEVLAGLAGGSNLVLAAPPGAGKTTGIPPALLSCSWASGGRILAAAAPAPGRPGGGQPDRRDAGGARG